MTITEEQIRAAAEATLTRWPAASAVLLFGSRARGDHRMSSDWDLAVVTDNPRGFPSDLPLLDLAEYDPYLVDIAFISDADIRRHRNRLGRLGCSLARDAKPIAGNWRPPSGLKEPELDLEMYRQEIENSLRRFAEALIWSVSVFHKSSAVEARRSAASFVNRSADAAGHLAKAMLVRNGHQPRSIHHLSHLADDIAVRDPELAEAIRNLNGETKADHTRHYADSPPAMAADITHATRRMHTTGRLLAAELPHWRNDGVEFEIEIIGSNTEELNHSEAVPLDETGTEAGRAVLALREGRATVLRGADELLAAWMEPNPESLAVEDDDPPPF